MKAVTSRGRCRRPKNVACQLSTAHPLKGAPYTVTKRDQQVIESTARIDIDLYNYRQKLPYVDLIVVLAHETLCLLAFRDEMVRPARFERATFRFGGEYSIQLSYGRIFKL